MPVAKTKTPPTLPDVLFDKADVGLCLVAPDSTVLRANDEWLRSTGFALDHVLGANIVALFPETRDKALAMHARARAGHHVEVPRHAQVLGGRETWWEGRIDPVAMDGGTGLLITARDVTDEVVRTARGLTYERAPNDGAERLAHDLDAMRRLHRLSTRLVCSEDFAQALEETVEAAIAITRADMGNIQLLDPASRTLKIAAHRGHEKWWLDFFESVPKGKGAACGAALQRGTRIIIDDVTKSPVFVGTPALEVQLRAGVRAVQSTPLVGSSGDLVGMISTHYRTPRRPDERDLRLLDVLARQTVDMIERQRAEEALRCANQQLREADRRKDEFLGMLSHELRNPLAPIRNSTYILRHSPPGSEQARRAQTVIERQTEHLTRLVDDLLDVTRVARGKIELRRARVDLRDLVERTAEDFEHVMEGRGVAFRTELPEGEVWTDADATRLAQLVGNLLHNASKFTRHDDEVAISLRVEGGVAEIRVRDTGAGIDPALLPRIFDPFVQGERTLARTEGGLGLGLAMVKGIAQLHDGSVEAESAGKGKGTEFVVRLPLVDATAPQHDVGRHARRVLEGRRVLVLVVDDNTDAAESLAEIVGMLGYAVEVAYDGASAIEKARTNPPDVVLCDLGLPGMSGFEVARALREAGTAARLFAVSGYAQPEDVNRAVEAGFDGHIAKPCDPEQIERLLS